MNPPPSCRLCLLFFLILASTGMPKGMERNLQPYRNLRATKENTFDFYILTMIYQPENCYQQVHSHHKHLPGCDNPMDYWKTHLTIHGLWPQNLDGSWPSFCSNQVFNETLVRNLEDILEKEWPNVDYDPSSPEYIEFWKHEWDKHGTCTGLTQHEYFEYTLEKSLDTPSIIPENYGGVVTKSDLESSFGEIDIYPVCSYGGKYLSEIRTCVAVSDTGNPTNYMQCPETSSREDNCHDVIHLAKFDTTADALLQRQS